LAAYDHCHQSKAGGQLPSALMIAIVVLNVILKLGLAEEMQNTHAVLSHQLNALQLL
jgi:acetylornithine/succinyldiaminopimelate/putrescine aminotransferase